MSRATSIEAALAAAPRAEAVVRKEAIAWYARLSSGEATDADRDAWQRWHGAHPDHQRAWRHFEALQAMFQKVPGHLAATTLAAKQRNRRQMLRSVAAITGGAALAGASWRLASTNGGLRIWLADYRTGPGEQRSVTLDDGSHLMLNTRSAVDVAMNTARRHLTLREGEILVHTARPTQGPRGEHKDPRPFTVQTPQGQIRALGTRFTVRQDGEHTVVSVLEDAVELRAARAPDEVVRLNAGQQARFSRAHIEAPQAAQSWFADWTRGSLIIDGWRLEDVVRELARYRAGRLNCDPAIADMRVSGVFPLKDTDKALAVITLAFPVRISGMTRYWVNLVPA